MAVLDCLARFNALPPDDAEQVLRACCASSVWAHDVSTLRPFTDVDTLYAAAAAAAAAALARLTERDLDDALAGHPRIGDSVVDPLSLREQSSVSKASAATLDAMAEGKL